MCLSSDSLSHRPCLITAPWWKNFPFYTSFTLDRAQIPASPPSVTIFLSVWSTSYRKVKFHIESNLHCVCVYISARGTKVCERLCSCAYVYEKSRRMCVCWYVQVNVNTACVPKQLYLHLCKKWWNSSHHSTSLQFCSIVVFSWTLNLLNLAVCFHLDKGLWESFFQTTVTPRVNSTLLIVTEPADLLSNLSLFDFLVLLGIWI